MDFHEAKHQLLLLVNKVQPSDVPKLVDWIRTSGELDDVVVDNDKVILRSIADELRASLPPDAMVACESHVRQKVRQRARPTAHVDAFLYDDERVDALCEAGRMSRCYCLACGSSKTAPLDFVSHSFSVSELAFLFRNVLPDLSGRTLVDVGSRLGAVLYGGYLFSAASRLVGVELSQDFVDLQNKMVDKYAMRDRVQVVHADVCTQDCLLQSADVVVINNVFQFFMEPDQQVRAWKWITQTLRKTGSLLVTVPSLQETFNTLQDTLPVDWVLELPLDYDVYVQDADPEALRQIHLYKVV
ncbi:uncharacterized protein zgc:109986 [Nerophis ophidion]|uniref:uncharacterized protein zgc:109986 n=1 Tax=Nerophis ophidion TaxID=159077 RepID=UPI002ADFE1D1|nr:uncharacterized protein zgc:109986 [Nerophis ophidion]